MDDRVSDLLNTVREEIQVCRRIAEHAQHKTALLVQGRVEAILDSDKIEETHCLELQQLENKAKRLTIDLCSSFGIPPEEGTLRTLARNIEQPYAAELRTQISLFRDVLRQMEKLGRRNRSLTDNALQYSKELLAFVSNATGFYGNSGSFDMVPVVQPTFSRNG